MITSIRGRVFRLKPRYPAKLYSNKSVERNHKVLKFTHFISEEDIRRRYERSIKNLTKLIQVSEFTSVIDNTVSPRQLLAFEAGRLVFQHRLLPTWIIENLGDLLNDK